MMEKELLNWSFFDKTLHLIFSGYNEIFLFDHPMIQQLMRIQNCAAVTFILNISLLI